MVNQQLVDYIKQQAQAGVSRDAIKKALLDAGWPTADVEDSLRAAEPAAPASQPVSTGIDAAVAMGGASPTVSVAASSLSQKDSKFFSEPGTVIEEPSHGPRIAMIVMGAVILILLATLGYIYFSLNGKVSSVSGENAVTASEGEALRAQVRQLTADKDALTGQVTSLTEQSQVFAEEVAFLAPSTGTTTEVSATVRGTVSGATGAYYLTTAHGIRISIKNSKDARVDFALKPLLAQTAILIGTHRAGVLDLTVSSINGTELASISVPAATSTTP